MALRNNPYLPLYIQDFMTDEKLAECSPHATGVYIRIMCLLHKCEIYGKFLLNQNYKQSSNQIFNFACNFARHLPYTTEEIERGLIELINNHVLYIEGDYLCQKRMVKDGEISLKRVLAGSKGGNPNLKKSKVCLTKSPSKSSSKNEAKLQANSDNEIDNDNDININDNIENKKEGLREEEKEKKKKLTFSEDVEYLYSLYPSKCPKRNMGTGKSSNDKKKLESLLKTMPKEELEFTIKSYVEESLRNNSFLKNFSTLLNNLPDMGYLKEQPIIKAQTSKYR